MVFGISRPVPTKVEKSAQVGVLANELHSKQQRRRSGERRRVVMPCADCVERVTACRR